MAPIDARRKLEQIRRNKTKNKVSNVKDLRQLLSRKNKSTPTTSSSTSTRSNGRSPNRVVISGRIVKTRSSSTGGQRGDLRRSIQGSNNANSSNSNNNNNRNKQTVASSSQIIKNRRSTVENPAPKTQSRNTNNKQQVQQYYVPPHRQPTYVIANPAPVPQPNHHLTAMGSQGASVLVSNLLPTITQPEIIELFGSVGDLTGVNMINPTTALVTYQNSRDAIKAVKEYHQVSLDERPMIVNMMPNSMPATNIRSYVRSN